MSSQPVHIMSSLCRLSATSQPCLNPFCGTQIQTKLETAGSPMGSARCSAAAEIQCSGQAPDQLPDSSKSRNAKFVISLMDICNKMILPLSELHQDCDSCQANHLVQPQPFEDSDRRCPSESFNPTQSNEDFLVLMAAMRQTNQHKPTERCCGDHVNRSLPGNWNMNNANSTGVPSSQAAGASSTSSQVQQLQHLASTKSLPSAASPSANPVEKEASAAAAASTTAAATTMKITDSCRSHRTPSTAQSRPLAPYHGMIRWNLAEFQDFRTTARTHQVLDPVIDPGRHRHMIIMDCHRRLRNVIDGFHTPFYRPY